MSSDSLLGVGIYTTAEAARLVGVEATTIRRWLNGYTAGRGEQRRTVKPLWRGDLAAIDAHYALSFLDLMEARYVWAYRAQGLRWRAIRRAHARAAKDLGTPHPFCAQRFVTDGHEILRYLPDFGEDAGIDEVRTRQRLFEDFMLEVVSGVEFEGGTASRWYPLGKERSVVLDPTRSFGRPILEVESVPTWVLAAAVDAGNSPADVAQWYEVGREALDDALEFERGLAA